MNVRAEQYYGFSALSVGTSSVSPFTGLNSATIAFLSFEGSAVRFRLDGVTATSGSGHLFAAAQTVVLNGADAIKGFNVICPTVTGTIMANWGSY